MDKYKTNRLIPTATSQETSIESRNKLENQGKKHRYRKQIHQHIASKGAYGSTCDEGEVELGLRHQTASCFIRFLTQDGFLIKSKYKRMTRANRNAVAWIDNTHRHMFSKNVWVVCSSCKGTGKILKKV